MDVLERPEQINAVRRDDTLVLQLTGDWLMAGGLTDVNEVFTQTQMQGVRTLGFDLDDLGNWDSKLTVLLLEAMDYAETNGITVQEGTIPTDIHRLIRLARAVPEKETHAPTRKKSMLVRAGEWGISMNQDIRSILSFSGEVTLSLTRMLTGRSNMRWRDFWYIIMNTGPRALPITALIAFLIGLILAFLGAVVLESFNAEIYNAYLVGFGMLRELGALMTGIIMAGRTGAAFAAELGSMKISEEIDALETMGISSMDFLVLPRILALTAMMPLLTLYADFVGVISGMTITNLMMDLSPALFIETMLGAIGMNDFLLGIFKGFIFGTLIAFSGCLRGMQSGSSAGAVGIATTSAVVTGITLIILANAIIDYLAILFGV